MTVGEIVALQTLLVADGNSVSLHLFVPIEQEVSAWDCDVKAETVCCSSIKTFVLHFMGMVGLSTSPTNPRLAQELLNVNLCIIFFASLAKIPPQDVCHIIRRRYKPPNSTVPTSKTTGHHCDHVNIT